MTVFLQCFFECYHTSIWLVVYFHLVMWDESVVKDKETVISLTALACEVDTVGVITLTL